MANKIKSTRQGIAIEWGIWTVAILAVLWTMRESLAGLKSVAGDTLVWYFPAFQFVAEAFFQAELPLWNPFVHAGEPFYPVLIQRRLLEPGLWALLIVAKVFGFQNSAALFHWHLVIQMLVVCVGSYFLLRPLTQQLWTRATLIIVLLFSAYFLGSFRQIGLLNQFAWTPYLLIYLVKIFGHKGLRWGNFLLATLFFGLHFQSYWFTGQWIFLLFLFLAIWFFRRDLLKIPFRTAKRKILVCLGLLVLMGLPNLSIYLQKDQFVFPLRMVVPSEDPSKPNFGPVLYEGGPEQVTQAIQMGYPQIAQTGTFSSLFDLLQMITPASNGSIHLHGRNYWWGTPSEAFLFLGTLVWIIALWGMIFGQHPLKRVGLFCLGGIFLYMLGPPGLIHRLLYFVYPPASFVRNSHCCAPYFLLIVMGFFVVGLEKLLTSHFDRIRLSPKFLLASLLGALTIGVIAKIACELTYPSSNFLFVGVLASVAILWIVVRVAGRRALFMSLVLAQFGVVLWYYPVKTHFLAYFFFVVGVPIGSLLVLQRITLSKKIAAWALGAIVFGISFVDLIYGYRMSRYLFDHQQTPLVSKFSSHYPTHRAVAPRFDKERFPALDQSVRYQEQLDKRPYAFSALYKEQDQPLLPTSEFDQARRLKRWNSYHLLNSYFALIHSPIESVFLESYFAIDRPLFRFYETARPGALKEMVQQAKASNLSPDTLFLKDLKNTNNLKRIEAPRKQVLRVRVTDFGLNSVKLQVETPSSGWLYWSDAFDPNWVAHVNDKPQRIYQANEAFKAVAVREGASLVEFRYRPWWIIASLISFGAAVLFCLLGALISTFAIVRSHQSIGVLQLRPSQ